MGGSSTTPIGWNDVVFVEDASLGFRYVVANEADLYLASDNETQYGYVTVVDAVQQKVAARVRVGGRPVHAYSINQTNTVWSHSDAEGAFYVIAVNNSQNVTVATTVQSYVDVPAHGKLVVNDALYPIGYGTNVGEQIISKFSLANATRIGHFQYNTSLSNSSSCVGTHTIVYSRVNKHLLIECVDGSGVLEWNTANDSYVALHNITGVVTGAPADDMIFVGSNTDSRATMIKPGANGQPSSLYAVLTVDYNPAYPAFWSNSTSTLTPTNFTDYQILFPLTRNTNYNNIRAAGDNVTTEAYLEAPSDCQYGAAVSTASVGASSSPGLSLASSSSGTVITPTCGACAAGINNSDPSQFNASLSGLGVLNLTIFLSGAKNTSTSLVSAGATAPQASLETGANQCSFSTENYRAIKRGGAYVATIADLPQPSLYVIKPASESSPSQFVGTATNPTSLAWVPSST